jgi:hypothetical protein
MAAKDLAIQSAAETEFFHTHLPKRTKVPRFLAGFSVRERYRYLTGQIHT